MFKVIIGKTNLVKVQEITRYLPLKKSLTLMN